jgi:N-acetylated-alpha-linked acidic dipeptidase
MKSLPFVLALYASTAFALENGQPALHGYQPEHAATEIQWEQKFRALPDAARIREYARHLSARPHHVGSPYDKENAEWLVEQLRSFGLDAKIETFDALFPTPKVRKLELLGPNKYVAKLDEKVLKDDPTTAQKSEQLPTYLAYARDGDVTGRVVYANYGTPEDYRVLEERGISVKGAIVLVRYGANFRSVKPRVAAEHGAIGVLLFSDPRDDGYARGDTYPKGPTRPADGVQRGTVNDAPIQVGDPQTPGYGAVPGAKLVPLDQLTVLTKVPTLPISYEDALPFLQAIEGEIAPESWRGALPVPYKTGISTAEAHLVLASNWDRKPLYDVIAKIPGSEFPDQWVIRGNHHDAWVNGAADPVSGTSPELEEGRALGELLKQGWRPKRTIIYAIWDGEEQGLLGSTEWVETHAEDLRQHAVAYINTDGNGRGFLGAAGSHSLEHAVNEVAKEIVDPETQLSVWKRKQLAEIAQAKADQRAELRTRPDLRIGALGTGSDYTAFLDHLGIASLNLGYGGEDEGGQYHSIYDDFKWYTQFEDTDFVYGRALAQTAGTLVLRLANADVIPFKYSNFADTVSGYVSEVKKLAEAQRAELKEHNTQVNEGVYTALHDPKKHREAARIEALPPYFNFALLDQASENLNAAAAAFDKAYDRYVASGRTDVNAQLLQIDRAQIDEKGLPGRPWYQNLIYAPGLYSGYGVKTLPQVREGIELKQWSDVDAAIVRTSNAIEREVDQLKKATQILESK